MGHVSQMYAVRQAIAKGLVAYTQKYVDEATKKELKDTLLQFDRTLLVADPRRNGTEEGGWSWCEIEIPKVVPLIYIYVYSRYEREKVDLNLAIIEEPINNTSLYYQYETIHIYQTSTSIVIVALKNAALCPERGEPSPSRRLVVLAARKRPANMGQASTPSPLDPHPK